MAQLDISPGEVLYYEFDAPGAAASTFVFVNALTGSTGTWQHADIGPAPRAAGHLIPIERPQAFTRALLEFARRAR